MTLPTGPVRAVFDAMPAGKREQLLETRRLIFEVAEDTGVGPLTETLKWGQAAYLTEETKAGTTIRLGLDGGEPSVFFHCQTSLIDEFRSDFPRTFRFAGNRALHLGASPDRDVLALCLARALTYHRTRRKHPA